MELDLYRKLFVHRSDVFAAQHEDGSYRPVRRPIEDMDIEEHLGGLASYGVYVIDPNPVLDLDDSPCYDGEGPTGWPCGPENTVKYVVFDLDTYDADALDFLIEAVNNCVLEVQPKCDQDRRSLLLESSGGKGYHIWLFFSEPITAAQARFFVAPVKEAYDALRRDYADSSDVAVGFGDWPALEVFPKQDTVPEGGFGNLVKLPLGVHAKSGKRSEFLTADGWANGVSHVRGLPVTLLPEVPAGYGQGKHSDAGRVAPFACISKLIEEGAPQGMRDNAMFHFAHYACGTGLPEDLVHEWAERVNTQFDPPLTDFEVEKSVRSAAGMSAPHPGCGADWLKDFCPGGENCFAPWNDEKPGRKAKEPEDTRPMTPVPSAIARRRAERERHQRGGR